MVKDIAGGSSEGLRLLRTDDEVAAYCPTRPMLAEEYLSGREYTVGVIDGRALPVVEIKVDDGLYDFAHKYEQGAASEICPAALSAGKTAYLQSLATAVYAVLGLRDVARVDFKEDARGRVCFLEANTLPGMTETSLLPLAAQNAGLSFPMLCERLARLACGHRGEW
jgi:D-alanine-D-alanine ligase